MNYSANTPIIYDQIMVNYNLPIKFCIWSLYAALCMLYIGNFDTEPLILWVYVHRTLAMIFWPLKNNDGIDELNF